MDRKARTNKLLLLGCDGLDPRLTRKYVDMGLMPNVKKYIENGAQRHDLVMLGGHPTVTPPMWTTLATGCYANVHGITGFFRKGTDITDTTYNLDSRLCKAEQLWNVFAEAGKKTLVWHWPGSAWPPSSDNPNLNVVDGTSPGSVNMSTAQFDSEFIVIASPNNVRAVYRTQAGSTSEVPCVITGLDEEEEVGDSAVILVAQRISTIMDADQIIVLDDGGIAGKGTHRELLRTCPVYQQIAYSQLSEEELA